MQVQQFENHALGRPYHAALIDLGARSQTQMHGHRDYYELMVVVGGDGEHHVRPTDGAQRVLPLRPRDLILVRPRDMHAIVGAVRFYNVAFPATAWRAFVALAKLSISCDDDPLPPLITVPDARVERASAQVLRSFYQAPSELDIITFWTEVVRHFDASGAAERPSGIPDWLTSAVAAMGSEENLRQGVSRMLALAHVSPAHLARTMRRYHNMTPSEFVADLRLRHAAKLLATTTLPIADIAHASGYHSPSYFTRRFHEAHGVTPRQFRRDSRHAFVPY